MVASWVDADRIRLSLEWAPPVRTDEHAPWSRRICRREARPNRGVYRASPVQCGRTGMLPGGPGLPRPSTKKTGMPGTRPGLTIRIAAALETCRDDKGCDRSRFTRTRSGGQRRAHKKSGRDQGFARIHCPEAAETPARSDEQARVGFCV